MIISNSNLSQDRFIMDILYSLLAAVPSETETNLNNLSTELPFNSDTTKGVLGVSNSFIYQPIEVLLLLLNLAAGK